MRSPKTAEVRCVEGEQPALPVGQHRCNDIGVVNLTTSYRNFTTQPDEYLAYRRAVLKYLESPRHSIHVIEYFFRV